MLFPIRSHRVKTTIKGVSFSIATILVVLAGGEAYYRFFGDHLRNLASVAPNFWITDSCAGFKNKANLKNHRVEMPGGNAFYVSTNSEGLRGKDIDLEKKSDTLRIVVVGGSFLWGWGVNDDEIWTVLLESRLNENRILAKTVEIINGGRGGFGSVSRSVVLYVCEIQDYRPDVVIVANAPDYPTSIDLEYIKSVRNRDVDSHYVDDKGYLRTHPTNNPLLRKVVRKSALVRELFSKLNITNPNEMVRRKGKINTEKFIEQSDEALAAFDIFATLLAEKKIPYLVVTQNRAFKYPEAEKNLCLKLEERGIPCINTFPAIGILPKNFGPNGHWSAEGHKIVANMIYEFLVEKKKWISESLEKNNFRYTEGRQGELRTGGYQK